MNTSQFNPLRDLTRREVDPDKRTLVLRFLASPVRVLGADGTGVVGVEVARFVSVRWSTLILNAGAAGDAWPDFQSQYFDAQAGSWSTLFTAFVSSATT